MKKQEATHGDSCLASAFSPQDPSAYFGDLGQITSLISITNGGYASMALLPAVCIVSALLGPGVTVGTSMKSNWSQNLNVWGVVIGIPGSGALLACAAPCQTDGMHPVLGHVFSLRLLPFRCAAKTPVVQRLFEILSVVEDLVDKLLVELGVPEELRDKLLIVEVRAVHRVSVDDRINSPVHPPAFC